MTITSKTSKCLLSSSSGTYSIVEAWFPCWEKVMSEVGNPKVTKNFVETATLLVVGLSFMLTKIFNIIVISRV